MRIALANLNPTVGDLAGNSRLIVDRYREARDAGAALVVLPELALSGYPPKDLLLVPAFLEACLARSEEIAKATADGGVLIFGAPLMHAESQTLRNSLVVCRDGRIEVRYDKRLLPTYDVFDEDRYFQPGDRAVVIEVEGVRVGLSICEDLWRGFDVGHGGRYAASADPVTELVDQGAQLIVNPSASPFVMGKHDRHRAIVAEHANRHGIPVLAVNQLGANDELIFDGSAWGVDREGRVLGANTAFGADLAIIETDADASSSSAEGSPTAQATVRRLIEALTLGVRDYCRKTGFGSVCLGLSGGIDSAVTAAIAQRALGAEHVTGLALPGKYSTDHSIRDAEELAERLGVRMQRVPIAEPYDGFESVLNGLFREIDQPALGERLPDITEENLQSRVRGVVLMALSNRTGALLLTTGNKSELAVGYCTLYGDMNGGLGVISDVPKTVVFEMARFMNEHFEELGFAQAPIPENSITKPPSAELAPDQKDTDSLPPYEVLDEIIRRHVELFEWPDEIVRETGFDPAVVERIVRLIALNEYKRKQTPVGLKVTGVAFGTGRRMPIVQRTRV